MNDVVIVGGGTAGWLSATHIKSALGNAVSVTLIESPSVPSIGVGEGTTPTLRAHLHSLNLEEDHFMRGCGASFKNGIRFVGWCGGDGPKEFIHPFSSGSGNEHDNPIWSPHVWLRLYRAGEAELPQLADACWPETWLIHQQKAPVVFQNGTRQDNAPVSYAWHLDAARFGLYLKKIAIQRGATHIVDDMVGLQRTEEGKIDSVVTKEHGNVSGQFFVDCTGFHRLLMKELTDGFIDFRDHLLNDTAVTARIPYPNGKPIGIEACTTSVAMKHGWLWHIPLYDRIGTGYVYSSHFVTDGEAEDELVEYLGAPPPETQRIRFQTGYYAQSWVQNCVSIGLSGGFLEPLEATGIAMITHALFRLLEYWPDQSFPEVLRKRFNEQMSVSYEWTRDFLAMHYCFSQREDTPYWLAVRDPGAIPDSVHEKMEFLNERWPFAAANEPVHGYRVVPASVACVLAGFNKFPQLTNSYVEGLSEDHVKSIMEHASKRIQSVTSVCPDHGDFLIWLNSANG